MWETQVLSLGGEGPLEKEMATHSSTLAWKIPWTDMGSQSQRQLSYKHLYFLSLWGGEGICVFIGMGA